MNKEKKIIQAWAYVWGDALYSNGVGNFDIYRSKKQAEINSTENQRKEAKLVKVEITFIPKTTKKYLTNT